MLLLASHRATDAAKLRGVDDPPHMQISWLVISLHGAGHSIMQQV